MSTIHALGRFDRPDEGDHDLIDRTSSQTFTKTKRDPEVERLLNILPHIDAARSAVRRGITHDPQVARSRARGHLRRALDALDAEQ